MVKKEVLIWIPVVVISGVLYYSVIGEKKQEVESINHSEPVETVQTVKKESFVGIEDEVLSTAIDKIDPDLYRKKEQLLLQGRRYTIDNNFNPPLRRVINSEVDQMRAKEALKSLMPNENYGMEQAKPTYIDPKIILEINKNPKLIDNGTHKRYSIDFSALTSDKDIKLLENTTNFENTVGNLSINVLFDYSPDLYKPQRDIYEENGTVRNQEVDVYPENYIIESLEQRVNFKLDGIQFTKLLDVPEKILMRTVKSPKDYECIMEKRYFSNIGSSFNADYICDGLPNINDYEGQLTFIFKK